MQRRIDIQLRIVVAVVVLQEVEPVVIVVILFVVVFVARKVRVRVCRVRVVRDVGVGDCSGLSRRVRCGLFERDGMDGRRLVR